MGDDARRALTQQLSSARISSRSCRTSIAIPPTPHEQPSANVSKLALCTTERARAIARATITVQHAEAVPYDQATEPALVELNLTETFAGDWEGDSPVRALQVRRDAQTAQLVSMQRFRGKLSGRRGTFVLQGAETVEKGKITATWFVVPGSGTDELAGLRGEGGFAGEFGKGSQGTLEYWFE